MKRTHLSTLMLLVVIVALCLALVVQQRRITRLEDDIKAMPHFEFEVVLSREIRNRERAEKEVATGGLEGRVVRKGMDRE
jgi:hypothetical protein